MSLNIEGFNHQTRSLSSHIERTPQAVASYSRRKPINISHSKLLIRILHITTIRNHEKSRTLFEHFKFRLVVLLDSKVRLFLEY